ncbi:MAG: choice-of-anchor D domain-containing protein, partial [Myxococcota bacterium]|nr:choice-of-anchor D domain-containing protein [Myxococcota bacterium]
SIELETESPDLSIGVVETTTFGPGERTRIQVLYNSDHDEPDVGELVIELNVASQPEVRIPVSTPGQRADLIASPVTIDFGIVQAGAPKSVPVHVTNIGTATATLTDHYTSGDDDGDFRAEFEPGVLVAPGETVTVSLVYQPSGVNKDKGAVIVQTDREDVSLTINVEGQEETPLLVVEPATVQFGWVEPGGTKLAPVKLRNDGNTSVVIWALYLDDGAIDGVGITNPPGLPLELEPGEVFNMGALFSPIEEHAMTGEPVGMLVLESTDAAHNPLHVPFYGAAGVPDIMVVPSDTVDFAYVAEGFAAKRAVTVLNVGDEAVTIEAATLEDATSEEFGLDVSNLPATLNPSDSVVFDALFENQGGDEGTEFARLMIDTTDKLVPTYPLDVVARRSERPTCEPAFVPDILSMGAFKPGTSGTGTLHLVNYGSGNCEYRDWDLIGCTKVVWGIRTEFDCDPL